MTVYAIIPSYITSDKIGQKRKELLNVAIKSLLNQKYQLDKIIVSINYENDQFENIKLIRNKKITYYHHYYKQLSQFENINYAMQKIQFEPDYILLFDDDDIAHPSLLKEYSIHFHFKPRPRIMYCENVLAYPNQFDLPEINNSKMKKLLDKYHENLVLCAGQLPDTSGCCVEFNYLKSFLMLHSDDLKNSVLDMKLQRESQRFFITIFKPLVIYLKWRPKDIINYAPSSMAFFIYDNQKVYDYSIDDINNKIKLRQ